jgi:hypothetical protein
MLTHRKSLVIFLLVALVVLLGGGGVGIAALCDYTPADRTLNIGAFTGSAGDYQPSGLIDAAQTDVKRELGIKGRARPGSTMAIYGCEGATCVLRRATFSFAIDPRCPFPRDTVTAADYDFQVNLDKLDVSSRTVAAEFDQMISHWHESPTPIERALEIVRANLDSAFVTTYPRYSIALNAVGDHWDVSVQPSDPTSNVLLVYQIQYGSGALQQIGGS